MRIHFNRSWYNSLSILQQHTSSTIYISFLNISSSHLQQTFNELLQSILHNILHNKLVMYYFNKHSTNIFEKRPSKQTFQQTIWYISTSQTFQQTIWYISTSQTFTIGELVIELHHIFIMIKWQVFNNIFKWLFTTFIQQTLTTTLSQNSHNNLWYNSSLYIFQRTSVSFVNVRIVHTSYHKTFITLQQTMKQFFITKLSKTIFVSFTY